MKKISIIDLKNKTGVGFGTSGIRDLIVNLSDETVYSYTIAFLKQADKLGEFANNNQVVIAGDRRLSTDRIMMVVSKAITDMGLVTINCGKIPTPAVVYYGIVKKIPSIMITGSHIPSDRNGVKFNLSTREILKKDEEAISQSVIEYDERLFSDSGDLIDEVRLPEVDNEGYQLYVQRFLDFFGTDLFSGKRIGLYGHSAVGRELMVDLLTRMGAMVVKIGFSSDDEFVAVDTDSVNEELIKQMHNWYDEHQLNHILSTDGDGDRPLLTDEEGNYIRAELMPILAGKYLGVEAMASSLTASTAVELSGFYKKVVRTKVGSPYIVEAMMDLEKEGFGPVAGYELNGGFLQQTEISRNGKSLMELPTRDALVSIFSILALSIETGEKLTKMVSGLPERFTYSLSIKGIPTDKSLGILSDWEKFKTEIESSFGKIKEVDLLDGLRLTFVNNDIVHFRPSKNSPEFRNYTESESYEKARLLSEKAIELIQLWTK